VISRIDLKTGNAIQPTAMVEAPILGANSGSTQPGSVSCSTTTTTLPNGSTVTQTCINGSIVTTTVTTCTTTTNGNTPTQTCGTSTTTGSTPRSHSWTRSIAPLPNQTAIINVTTSGFTVLPWSYAASVAPPQVTKVVSAADLVSPVAPGGLISILG